MSIEDINRNNKNRKADQFYVTFFKLPENVSNLFGRQTKSIGRPSLQFQTSNINRRYNQYTDMHQVRFDPVNIVMFDDENGITSQALYIQLFRQMNRGEDVFGRWPELDRDYRFDIRVELFNASGERTEGYVLKNCFFSEISHTEVNTTDEDTDNEINLTVTYDNIEYLIVDEYVELKEGVPMPSTSRIR